MKNIGRIAGAVIILFLMFIADLPNLPEAQAFRGRGAAFVVGAAVGSAGSSSAAAAAAASQQQAAASGQPLPLGTVVSALPGGCVATPVSGVNYYYCGGNFFQAMYQGSTLAYVTTKPK